MLTRLEYKAINSALHSIGASTLGGDHGRITAARTVIDACAKVGRHSPIRRSENYLMLLAWARDAWAHELAA
jgi:hypothetical protein